MQIEPNLYIYIYIYVTNLHYVVNHTAQILFFLDLKYFVHGEVPNIIKILAYLFIYLYMYFL